MNVNDLLGSWSKEFESRCDRVRHLIGNRHWLSDGRHKEVILAQTLERYVGPRWSICSGFIVAHHAELISPETDLFIADFSDAPPLLNEGSTKIVFASSVYAAIEVKSTFRKGVLNEVVEHQAKSLRALQSAQHDVWLGAFFFSLGDQEKSTAESIAAAYESLQAEGLLSNNRKFCIAILGDSVSFITTAGHQATAKVKRFGLPEHAFPVGILDMLAFLSEAESRFGNRTSIHGGLGDWLPNVQGDVAEIKGNAGV